MDIPNVTVEEMAKVDSLAMKHFGLEIYQLLENAGRVVAETSRKVLGNLWKKDITILCGKGNNGGDGMVAARFLSNWGARPKVILAAHPDELNKENREQLGVLRSMFVDTLHMIDAHRFDDAIRKSDLVIDGLLGYNIKGDPQGLYAKLIDHTNKNAKKVLAIDIPSGLEPDTGKPNNPTIEADITITLCLPKKGLLEKDAKKYVGKLFVGDIGVPHEVYEKMDLDIPKIFQKESIVKV